MNESPLISVIIPTYNRAAYILETVDSICSQTYTNWQCLIVDDGSTDNTRSRLESYITSDKRFSYIYTNNAGPNSARAIGFSKACGKYIQFLDSDDLLPKERFFQCIKEINGYDLLVTNFDRFKTSSQPFLPPYCKLSQNLLNLRSIVMEWDGSFTIPIHCGFFNAQIFDKISLKKFLIIKEDWIMWIEIFLEGFSAKYVDENLAHYRFSHQSLSFEFNKIPSNAALAYEHIYRIIPEEMKADFFKMTTERLCTRLAEQYTLQQVVPTSISKPIRKILAKIKSAISTR